MEVQIENLKSQMRGYPLTTYQKGLALNEYYKLLDYAVKLDKLTIKLKNLQAYYIEAEVNEFGEDGELVIEKTKDGDWVSKHELNKLIEELNS